jgi:hypothetical protein
VALLWHIASSLSVFPHSLSYFNELAGGPRGGHFHLLDGNLEWGQDFLYLEQWIKDHPEAHPLHVGFWGFLPLKDLGMDYSEFTFGEPDGDATLPAGWYAVSVNHMRRDFRRSDPKYATFLKRTPVAMVGYTVYIYHITQPETMEPVPSEK